MVSVEEIQKRIVSSLNTQPYETISLVDSLGRVLAQDVRARVTLPASDSSGVDGYAVISADIDKMPKTLHVVGEARASDPYTEPLKSGEAVRVFTAAPIPDNADAIIPDDQTDTNNDVVTVHEMVPIGMNIRYAGLDFTEEEVVLKKGHVMTARDIGLVAAMNVPWLQVRRKPRIAVLATGDELVMPGDRFGSGNVFASSTLALCAMIESLGGIATNLGISSDSTDSIHRLADAATQMDLLVTTGGLSGGAKELMLEALEKKGIQLNSWNVVSGTGKPLVFGSNGVTPILGFPGKPVTTMIFSTLFLKPAIEAMLGLPALDQPKRYAVLGRNLDINDVKLSYLRASLQASEEGHLTAVPIAAQDSFMLSTYAAADCLIRMNPAKTKRGDIVEIIPLGHGLVSS